MLSVRRSGRRGNNSRGEGFDISAKIVGCCCFCWGGRRRDSGVANLGRGKMGSGLRMGTFCRYGVECSANHVGIQR